VWQLSPPEQFATVFLGILDTETGQLEYCLAGHPSPAVLDGNGDAFYLPRTRSPVLGAFARAEFTSLETVIAPRERLVLFTDGVTEARRGGEFLGEERLLRLIAKMTKTPTQRIPQRLLDKALEFAEGHLRDDTVILCVARTKKPAGRL